MPRNPFGHVDLRVRSREEARAFYSALMPALGFPRVFEGQHFTCYAAAGSLPSAPWVGFVEAPDHVPNANRLAFWAEAREQVDRIGALLVELGAAIESGPRACPEYSASYYAVFFADPSGNRLEVVHRTD